jgi:hypothetical protein
VSEEVNRAFSPAGPESADRLYPRAPYGEPRSDARTKATGFFTTLLVTHSACCQEWHRLSALLALTMSNPDASFSPFYWCARTSQKPCQRDRNERRHEAYHSIRKPTWRDRSWKPFAPASNAEVAELADARGLKAFADKAKTVH